MPATATETRLSRATILGMIAMGVAVLVVANDFTALSVALPAMERAFGSDLTTVQWVINGYAMVFGVVIVTGGRLADMFGRRRIFMAGSAIFALFSVIGGFAPDIWLLLVCRFIMGIGGAMMWPAILGMTYGLLPPERAGLAGGVILGAAGFGNAVGPLLGGVLTDTIGWRWIFFLNLPVAAAAIVIVRLVVPPDAEAKHDRGIDYGGMAVLSTGLLALLLALDWALDLGWTAPLIVFLFALAAVALLGFSFVERRAGEDALVPRNVLKNRSFAAACLSTLFCSAIFFAALLYLPQFMSKELGFNAMNSGAGLLPMMGTFMVTSFIAGRLYELLGPKIIVSAGALLLGAGMVLLSMIHASGTHLRYGCTWSRCWIVLLVGHNGRGNFPRTFRSEPRRRNRLYVPDCRGIDRRRAEYGDRGLRFVDACGNSCGVSGGWRIGALQRAQCHFVRGTPGGS